MCLTLTSTTANSEAVPHTGEMIKTLFHLSKHSVWISSFPIEIILLDQKQPGVITRTLSHPHRSISPAPLNPWPANSLSLLGQKHSGQTKLTVAGERLSKPQEIEYITYTLT